MLVETLNVMQCFDPKIITDKKDTYLLELGLNALFPESFACAERASRSSEHGGSQACPHMQVAAFEPIFGLSIDVWVEKLYPSRTESGVNGLPIKSWQHGKSPIGWSLLYKNRKPGLELDTRGIILGTERVDVTGEGYAQEP